MITQTTGHWLDFPPTRVSLILGLRGEAEPGRRAAIERLCSRYWNPVCHYVRRAWSKSESDAQDLTQAFFLHLVEKNALAGYDPARGGFRKYMKSILRHVAADLHDAERAQKRGGRVRRISLEGDDGGGRLAECIEDARASGPERAFDAAWRREILGRAIERARAWFAARGREIKFRVFEATLETGSEPPTYAAIAARLGLKESDVRNHLFEVRERIRCEARAELAASVGGDRHLDDEYRELIGA